MQKWSANLQNQLENIRNLQEKEIEKSKFGSTDGEGKDGEVIKNIVRLFEQGWSITDIAKSLGVSRAYVELIIDRYNVK